MRCEQRPGRHLARVVAGGPPSCLGPGIRPTPVQRLGSAAAAAPAEGALPMRGAFGEPGPCWARATPLWTRKGEPALHRPAHQNRRSPACNCRSRTQSHTRVGRTPTPGSYALRQQQRRLCISSISSGSCISSIISTSSTSAASAAARASAAPPARASAASAADCAGGGGGTVGGPRSRGGDPGRGSGVEHAQFPPQ